MNFSRLSIYPFLFLGLMNTLILANSPTVVGTLSINNYWIRPSKGPNTAAYMTITNQSTQPDKLVKVECAETTMVELHDNIEEDGFMKMRPVPSIEIKEGTRELKPGGLHIMLMGLKGSFQGKETIPLTLHFKNAGKIAIDFPVKLPASTP